MSTSPSGLENTWKALQWNALAVHYHEIALKGGNRGTFTRQLARNIGRVIADTDVRIDVMGDRLLVIASPELIPGLADRISRVFGVALVRPVQKLQRDLARMKAAGVAYYENMRSGTPSFGVRTKRIDKTFGKRSTDIDAAVGRAIVEKTGAPVDLNNPGVAVTFRVYKDSVYLLGPDIAGPAGLPLGVSGRVLSLFSGGIDSAPAAWLAMRRGCKTDFLHFHTFANPDEVKATKIPALLKALLAPQGVKARLFLVPYHPFQVHLVTANIAPGLEVILFRRFMVRVADHIAERHDFSALVSGDNLGQVASQTLESLAAVDQVADRPLLQPLLTHTKNEIISLAKDIGTYDLSIQPYRDCCSIVSRRPVTKPRRADVLKAEAAMPVERMTEKALDELVIQTVGT